MIVQKVIQTTIIVNDAKDIDSKVIEALAEMGGNGSWAVTIDATAVRTSKGDITFYEVEIHATVENCRYKP